MPISRRSLVASSALLPALGLIRPAFGQEKLKVAGIHTVPVENAWNSRLHQAMLAAAEAGTIEYVFSESVANTDYVRAMRQYADGGAGLIVGEVYGVERESRQVAKDYPDTSFLMGSSAKEQSPNFGVFGTWNHEAAYLTGMLAAAVSKKNVYGAVGGYPIPEINRLINAFREGVKEVRPDATFLVQFIGTFFDPPKAKEAGLAQIDAGADILFGERIGTADAAKDRGILSIGSLLDYSPRYPGTVFANALWNFDPILAAAVADVKAGTPTGKDYSQFSFMKFGGNDISFDAALVPQDAVAPMEAKRTAIKSGAFVVGIDDSQPA